MFNVITLLFLALIYAPLCYGCVRLFGRNNGLKGVRFEAMLITFTLTPLLGIPLANYLLTK